MPFAAGLQQSLYARHGEIASEFERGDSLEDVLDRHLLAVEAMAETELVTSILLLSPDGRQLSHGAGPNLPRSYRDALDGTEIGPSTGSCGTAAYFGRPVYVTDIATDPLWADYRDLALAHGLRSCWSTPIRDLDGVVVGTFAIYHRTAGGPTRDELEAIDMITGHVARAILSAREGTTPAGERPRLRLVADNPPVAGAQHGPFDALLMKATKLEKLAAKLEQQAASPDSEETRTSLEILARDSRRLAKAIRRSLDPR